MSYRKIRTIASVAAAALIGIACVATEASARVGYHGGGVRVGGVHGGVYRGGYAHHGAYAYRGAYRGAYVRHGYGYGAAAVGAVAVGAAMAEAPYYNAAPDYYNAGWDGSADRGNYEYGTTSRGYVSGSYYGPICNPRIDWRCQ